MKKLLFVIVMIAAVYNLNAQVKNVNTIISETCRQAALQNKKALVIFHASWCIWCHKLDSSINDPLCKQFFDDNYVIEHITAFEVKDKAALNNPGAEQFLKAHHAYDQGIPAWYIFDKNGNILADSQLRQKGQGPYVEGSNIGCPANETEINYFIKLLEKTSNINQEQEEAIKQRFTLNKETASH